jgi:hypothetical protein
MNVTLRLGALATSAVAIGLAVPATGQAPSMTVTSTAEMTPKRAGTEMRPRSGRVDADVELSVPAGSEPALPTELAIRLPRGVHLNSGKYPTCAKRTLDRKGPSGCPWRSIVGSGAGYLREGFAGRHPKITLVNGGPDRLWAYNVYRYPVVIKEARSVTVRRLHSRKWAYEMTFGLLVHGPIIDEPPLPLSRFEISIGATKRAPDFLETDGGCPKRGFMPFSAKVTSENDQAIEARAGSRAHIACR